MDDIIISSKSNVCSNCDYFNTVNLCCFDNTPTLPSSGCHVKLYEMVPMCETDDCKLCPYLLNPCKGNRNNPVTKLNVNPHSGQKRLLESKARHVGGNAGRQSGKTEVAPYWILQEMLKHGSGDYLVISSAFPLMDKKLIPTYLKFFKDYLHLSTKDDFKEAKKKLFVHGTDFEATIFFGSATNANSLESSTALAAHLDEVGQDDFTADAYDAILGRLTRSRGRILYTTTLYNHSWYKREVFDRWKSGDPEYEVINWDSVVCPGFSKAEWEDRKKKMPTWKFNMQYRGIYDLPAGMIYNTFKDYVGEGGHLVNPFPILQSSDWHLAIDPGAVHTASGWFAEVNGNYYLVRSYLDGNMTTKEHVKKAMRFPEFGRIRRAVGGAGSEQQFRDDWISEGIHVREPEIRDVEAGIDKVISLLKEGHFFIFDTPVNQWIIEQFRTYSRELNDKGEPTERISHKNEYHGMDMVRYFAVGIDSQGDSSTKAIFQNRSMPQYSNTSMPSIFRERASPPKWR